MIEVIEKAILTDGTEIYLEDWSSKNTEKYPDLYGFQIGAYPIAKNGGRWIKSGEKFRLTISHNNLMNYTNEDVKADFEALKSGQKSLEDLSGHFWNGKKDMYYLGMIWDYTED